MAADLRRTKRWPASGKARLAWQDARGEPKSAEVTILDASPKGMRLLVPVAIPVRSMVTIQGISFRLLGTSGWVRYCRTAKLRYHVGIEFSHPISMPQGLQVDTPDPSSSTS